MILLCSYLLFPNSFHLRYPDILYFCAILSENSGRNRSNHNNNLKKENGETEERGNKKQNQYDINKQRKEGENKIERFVKTSQKNIIKLFKMTNTKQLILANIHTWKTITCEIYQFLKRMKRNKHAKRVKTRVCENNY